MCIDKINKKRVHKLRKQTGLIRGFVAEWSCHINYVPDGDGIVTNNWIKNPHTIYVGKPIRSSTIPEGIVRNYRDYVVPVFVPRKYMPYIHVWESYYAAKMWRNRIANCNILEVFIDPKEITACGWQNGFRVIICKRMLTGDYMVEEK